MPKKKTSKKQSFSFKNMPIKKLKNNREVTKINTDILMDKKSISKALWDCLVADDLDSFKEILKTHLELLNKEQLALEAGISRRTLFRMLSDNSNPSLSNISKIIHKLCA